MLLCSSDPAVSTGLEIKGAARLRCSAQVLNNLFIWLQTASLRRVAALVAACVASHTNVTVARRLVLD